MSNMFKTQDSRIGLIGVVVLVLSVVVMIVNHEAWILNYSSKVPDLGAITFIFSLLGMFLGTVLIAVVLCLWVIDGK